MPEPQLPHSLGGWEGRDSITYPVWASRDTVVTSGPALKQAGLRDKVSVFIRFVLPRMR